MLFFLFVGWMQQIITDFHRYLDTSLLEVNLNPKYVSVRIKGKLTQLKLQEEIKVE